MGNAIAKKFDVPKEYTATAGHHQLWKIWPGKSKETGENVSIWAFDKADLAKRKTNPITDKAVVEQIFQIMKKDFAVIKESIVCSSVVRYIETVEDSKTAIVFTTERIVCSMADIFSHFQGIEGGVAAHGEFFESNGGISEMEISKGLLNLSEGMQYLHNVQRKLHLNITPESVVIAAGGQWKLCGFGFSLAFIQGDQPRLASPYFLKASALHGVRVEPDLRYSGPECTDGGFNPPGIRYLTPATDTFALGLLVYEVYRYNLKNLPERAPHRPVIALSNNDVPQHHFALDAMKSLDFSFLPSGVYQLVVGLLQLNVSMRNTTADVVNHQYFVTGALAVLNMVENMHSRDVGTQSSQLISLQGQLGAFSDRILYLNILPALCKLCIANPALWVYALPLHVFLSSHISREKYTQFAGPAMAKGLAVSSPVETMQAFLTHVQFVSGMFDGAYFQEHVAMLFCNALEKGGVLLQTLAMEKLSEESVRAAFEPDALSEKLLPKLCKEACRNPEPTIKMLALYIISLFSGRVDTEFVAKNILPSLKYITDHEKDTGVSMCVVGNYEALSATLGTQYIATSILPNVQPMLVDTSLDRKQFEVVVNLVKMLLKKLFDARTAELGMPPVSVGETVGSSSVDPFAAAKNLIATAKRNSTALLAGNNSMGGGAATASGSSGTYGAPPPPPRAPPPLPTSAPPPLPTSLPPTIPHRDPTVGSGSHSVLSSTNTSTTNSGGIFGAVSTSPYGASTVSSSSTPISAYKSDFAPVVVAPPASKVPEYAQSSYSTTRAPSLNMTTSLDAGDNPFAVSQQSTGCGDSGAGVTPAAASVLSAVSATAAAASGAKPSSAPAAKSSGFGWFSSSSAAKAAPAKVEDSYKPPVVPMSASPATASSSSPAGGAVIDDMDDFLASFGKSSSSSSMPSSAPTAGGIRPVASNPSTSASSLNVGGSPFGISPATLTPTSGANTTSGGGLSSIEEQIRQTQAQIAQLSGSGNRNTSGGFGGAITPSPIAPVSSAPIAPVSTYSTNGAASSGNNLGGGAGAMAGMMAGMTLSSAGSQSQHYGQPQQQWQPQQQFSAPLTPGFLHLQQSQSVSGAGGVQQNRGTFGQQQQTMPASQSQYMQYQQQPQQSYGTPALSMGAPSSSGYSSASYNQHLQQQQPQPHAGAQNSAFQQPQQQQYGQSAGRIGTLPPNHGYQPPSVSGGYAAPHTHMAQPQPFQQQQQQQPYQQYQQPRPVQQTQQQQQQQPKGSVSSAFDFLN